MGLLLLLLLLLLLASSAVGDTPTIVPRYLRHTCKGTGPQPCPTMLPQAIVLEAIGNRRSGFKGYAEYWVREEENINLCTRFVCS